MVRQECNIRSLVVEYKTIFSVRLPVCSTYSTVAEVAKVETVVRSVCTLLIMNGNLVNLWVKFSTCIAHRVLGCRKRTFEPEFSLGRAPCIGSSK